jgi:hypothetical protein
MTKQSPKKRNAKKLVAPSYAERTDRIRALGEAARNCAPLIGLALIPIAYYFGVPTALLTLAAVWARPP